MVGRGQDKEDKVPNQKARCSQPGLSGTDYFNRQLNRIPPARKCGWPEVSRKDFYALVVTGPRRHGRCGRMCVCLPGRFAIGVP